MNSLPLTVRRALAVALVFATSVSLAAEAGPAAGPFTREQVVGALARELTAHFNLEGELQLELLRPWTPPARVAATWALSILEFPAAPAASMLLRCRVLADTVAVADFSLPVRASLWRDAWVARQPLMLGATFDAALLEVRRTDVLRDRDVLPATVGDQSYVMIRAVTVGRPLTWRDISRRPLVRKGDFVEVSAVDGMLFVTLKAQAMENGAQGEVVTLRNPESRKNFSAVVIDENRVQVRF